MIAGVGGFHFFFQAGTPLHKRIYYVIRTIPAQAGVFILPENTRRRWEMFAVEAGQRLFLFEGHRGFVGKHVTAGGAGQRFTDPRKAVIARRAFQKRFLTASRADDCHGLGFHAGFTRRTQDSENEF